MSTILTLHHAYICNRVHQVQVQLEYCIQSTIFGLQKSHSRCRFERNVQFYTTDLPLQQTSKIYISRVQIHTPFCNVHSRKREREKRPRRRSPSHLSSLSLSLQLAFWLQKMKRYMQASQFAIATSTMRPRTREIGLVESALSCRSKTFAQCFFFFFFFFFQYTTSSSSFLSFFLKCYLL